jgi:hypothetical protein
VTSRWYRGWLICEQDDVPMPAERDALKSNRWASFTDDEIEALRWAGLPQSAWQDLYLEVQRRAS